MAIKTRFVMPTEVFYAFRELGYMGSAELMFSQFCGKYGITDTIIRHKAQADGTTITEAARRLVVDKHPEMFDVWKTKQGTPKPHQPVRDVPTDDAVAVQKACQILAKMLADPDDGYVKRQARDYVAKHAT